MKNCAEKKQTTLTKSFEFTRFTLEFTIRGLSYLEYKKFKTKINDNSNNPEYLRIRAKSEVSNRNPEAEQLTVEEIETYAKIVEEISTTADMNDFGFLVECLTPSITYEAGYKLITDDEIVKQQIEKLDDALCVLDVEDINGLIEIAYNLTTLSKATLKETEVAEDEVK